MADFYTALGVIGFALAMLGLIWVLDRVWVFLRYSSSLCRSWCSSTSVTRCSSPRSS